MWSLSTSTGLPGWEHCPTRYPQHETFQTSSDPFSQSTAPFLYTAQIYFLHFSCISPFPEIIKHNIPKMFISSSLFSTKMATQKFTNFDKFFKMHVDMTAVMIV